MTQIAEPRAKEDVPRSRTYPVLWTTDIYRCSVPLLLSGIRYLLWFSCAGVSTVSVCVCACVFMRMITCPLSTGSSDGKVISQKPHLHVYLM